MRTGNQQGTSCGTCLVVCPWNKPFTPFHRAVGWAMRHSAAARSVAIWGDDLMGYGKAHPEEKWWFDVEEQGWRAPAGRTEKQADEGLRGRGGGLPRLKGRWRSRHAGRSAFRCKWGSSGLALATGPY